MRLLDDKLIEYSDGNWNLVGQVCEECGKIAFPRKRVCPECFGLKLGRYLLSKHGILHTYTTTYLGSPSLPSPYSMGFLDLPEGIKLLGIIRAAESAAERLRVGMAMDVVFGVLRKDPDGEPVYSYLFEPSSGEQTS